jgi:hypothetical protein
MVNNKKVSADSPNTTDVEELKDYKYSYKNIKED